MSKKDGVLLASRALALLFTVWALTAITSLPGEVFSFIHHSKNGPIVSSADQYWSHYYLIGLSFLVVRIVGYSLLARWLYKGGPEVEESLWPSSAEENASR